MALQPGQLISGYRVERLLGAGGMGTVYLAADPVLPRRLALKVLSTELSQDPDFAARFTREADLAATLDHPNIVTVHNRGESGEGQLWIAMQYVAGRDASVETDEGRMTPERAIYVIAEVAKALDYAHRRNLVHRDVKPANFLLSADDDRVLLADFGIARALDDSAALTASGAMLGTVSYAAPEVFDGVGVDRRADIYALGCSLYRLLTGSTPFAGAGSMPAIMAAHVHAPPPAVTDRAPWLPDAINPVIATALAKSPGERHQSAGAFAAAAAAALRGAAAPTHAASPTPTSNAPTQDWATPPSAAREAITDPRRPAPSIPAPPSAPAADPGRQPRPRRHGAWTAAALTSVLVIGAVVAAFLLYPHSERHEPRTFTHLYGATTLAAVPHAVAAIGLGDADAVLSLGEQPVVVVAPGGRLPTWLQRLVTSNVTVVPHLEAEVIAAAKPDAIIATGDMDRAAYADLSGIAPTITRPPSGAQWNWQTQLSWVGQILDRDSLARELLDAARARQAQLRSRHPAFDGKTIAVVTVSDDGVTAALAGSPAADYLEGLGFDYSPALQPDHGDDAAIRVIPDPAALNTAATSVRIVIRTDKAAGGGGYNGLPTPFTLYRGTTVIVDDPQAIAALTTGGYAATEYLDGNLVDLLARYVH